MKPALNNPFKSITVRSDVRRYLEVSETTFQALLKNHPLQGMFTVVRRFPISRRLTKALSDVCHVFFARLRLIKSEKSSLYRRIQDSEFRILYRLICLDLN